MQALILALALVFASVVTPGVVDAQVAPLAPPGTPAARFPKPDRPVAEIISPRWASDADRDRVDEVGQVARAMGIGPGMTVADIGAGSGYYTLRLARIVGPAGRILAQDVTPAYLADLEKRVRELGLPNVTVGRGEPHDPRLPAGSVDVALLVHMYHEITQPFGLLYNLASAMKPDGRVGIVDLDDIPSRHGTPPALLRCELAAVGYRETGFVTLYGGVGYLATFAPPAANALPRPADIKPCSDEATRRRPGRG
jgi:SAM-dependent methyltransferase